MTTPTSPPNPSAPLAYSELPKRTLYLTMTGLMLSLLLAALDQTVVGTAMPRIVADLNGFNHYAWVTTAYLLTSTAVVPIVGKLSDLYGRKQFLVGGAVFFVITSMLCGLAADMVQLSLFRGLQGIGAGILMSSVFTVISVIFPPAERGKIQGIFGAVFGLASITGPLVGGFLTDQQSWRWVFYVNLPVGAAAVAMLVTQFPNIRPNHLTRPKIDFLGAIVLMAAICPLLLALSLGGHEYTWGSAEILGLLGFGLVMLAIFPFVEQRASEPIIPLRLLSHRIVTIAGLGLLVGAMGMFGAILYIPLFIQGVIGASATNSGLLLAPMMGTMVVSSILGGQLISRTGRYKLAGIAGMGTMTLGMLLLATMGPDADYGTVIRNMMILGVGMGPTMPIFTLAAQNAVDVRELGVVTSFTQFSRSIGGTLGAALFGSLLTNRFGELSTSLAVERGLPPEAFELVRNPQALVDPSAAEALPAALVGSGGTELYDQVLVTVKLALSGALHDMFLAATLVLGLGVLLMLVMREVPLRKTHRPAPDTGRASEGGARPEVAARAES